MPGISPTSRRGFLAAAATAPWWMHYPAWAQESRGKSFSREFDRAVDFLLRGQDEAERKKVAWLPRRVDPPWRFDAYARPLARLVNKPCHLDFLAKIVNQHPNRFILLAPSEQARVEMLVRWALAVLVVAHLPPKPVLKKGLKTNHHVVTWLPYTKDAFDKLPSLLLFSFFPHDLIRETLVSCYKESLQKGDPLFHLLHLPVLVADVEVLELLLDYDRREARTNKRYARSAVRRTFGNIRRVVLEWLRYMMYTLKLDAYFRIKERHQALLAFQVNQLHGVSSWYTLKPGYTDRLVLDGFRHCWVGGSSFSFSLLPHFPVRRKGPFICPYEAWIGPLAVRELQRGGQTLEADFLIRQCEYEYPAPMVFDLALIALVMLHPEKARETIDEFYTGGLEFPHVASKLELYRDLELRRFACSKADELRRLIGLNNEEVQKQYGSVGYRLKRYLLDEYLKWLRATTCSIDENEAIAKFLPFFKK